MRAKGKERGKTMSSKRAAQVQAICLYLPWLLESGNPMAPVSPDFQDQLFIFSFCWYFKSWSCSDLTVFCCICMAVGNGPLSSAPPPAFCPHGLPTPWPLQWSLARYWCLAHNLLVPLFLSPRNLLYMLSLSFLCVFATFFFFLLRNWRNVVEPCGPNNAL